MNPAQKLARWSDQLRDISSLGGHFAENIYDKENYARISHIALEMLALATNHEVDALEPLRETLFKRPTPLATADAAIIDDDGRLLLIQRADNGMWAFPGGALEVGESPSEGAVREAFEETGVTAEVFSFVGVFDSLKDGSTSPFQLYKFTFLCRPLPQPVVNPPSHGLEILDQGWFAEDSLPLDISPGHMARMPLVFRAWRGDWRPFCD